MVEFGGFETESFGEFETELENVEVKQVKKFDRGEKAKPGGSVHCTPVVHEGKVYFGACDQYFYAVDGITGKELWRFKGNGMFLANFPIIKNDVIYICCSSGNIHALTLEGKELWNFKSGGLIFSMKPVVENGMVYFGSHDGNVYCLNAETGKELWRFKTGGAVASAPAYFKNMLFIGSYDENFYCLDSITGKEIWRFRMGAEILNEQYNLVHNGKIFFASFDNFLYCLDVMTGKEVWRFRTGKYGNSVGPEILNGKLIHASRDGILYSIDPETGKELWRFKAELGIFSGLLIHENTIYFGCEDGNLYVIDENGKELWRFRTGGPVYHFPAVWNDTLYFGSWDCHLYAVNLETRREVWRFSTSDSSPAYMPPSRSMFEVGIKKETHIEEPIPEDKYKSKKKQETVSLSDYHVESEYSSESEYKQKSDYDVQWVISDDVMILNPENTQTLTFERRA